MEERRQGWLIGSAVVAVGVLAALVLQLSAIESRMVEHGRQLRVLGEATEKVAQQMKRMKAGGAATGVATSAADEYANVKVLHPELPNFLTAPQKHWPPAGAKTDGTISVDYRSGDPRILNPVIANSVDVGGKLLNYVQSGLTDSNRWTDPNTYYADLAWRLEVTDDYKEYTFYLRRGVKWHPVSGVDLNSSRYSWLNKEHEVTAHDVVFFMDMTLHPQVQNGALKNYYSEVKSYKALDDYTFQIRWKKTQALNLEFSMVQPLPEFLYAYSEDGKRIPEATVGLQFNQHWYNNKGMVGVGAYRFAEYVPGSHIVLERNEDFYGELPATKTIRYPIYTDSAQTVLKLKSGELTFGELMPGQYREEFLKYKNVPAAKRPTDNPFLNGDIVCDEVARPVYRFIGWNADRPQFSDKLTRRAMTLALNRHKFVDNVISGLGTVTNGPFVLGSPYFAPDVQTLPFDLKQSAELLSQAGWQDSDGDGILDKAMPDGSRMPFEFSLMIYAARPEFSSIANIIKEDLLSLGIKMKIEPAEWSLMLKRLDEKQFDAVTLGWGLSWATDPYQIWHSSQADVPKGSNRVGFRNKQADALIEKLRVTLDIEKRTIMLREFHRIVHEEQPYSFLYVPKTPYCYRSSLKNVEYSKIRPVADLRTWWNSAASN